MVSLSLFGSRSEKALCKCGDYLVEFGRSLAPGMDPSADSPIAEGASDR